MRLPLLILLLVVAAGNSYSQSTTTPDSNVVLKVSLATSQREFHMGETIPLRLAFSGSGGNRYQVNMAQYDRSGRMSYEHFTLTPAEGVVDPLPTFTSSLGGLTTHKLLTLEPWTLNLNLNELIRFTQPGDYRLVVSSNRVEVRDPSHPLGATPVNARANEIALKIIPADRAWQSRVLREAVAVLDAPAPAKHPEREKYTASRRQAIETLRFLGSAGATRELARRMRDEDSDGLDYLCMLGLISSPEREAARDALEEALADPDRAIGGSFLYALQMINSEPGAGNTNWQTERQRAFEKLVAALPAKRGKTLSISLSAAVSEAWNGNVLPRQATDKLVNQLLSMFDQLSVNEQNQLLEYNWDKIGGAAMLPILRRYAQAYRDFPLMAESRASDSLQLSATALQRWYELDPAAARPAIITEIKRPRPRYDAKVLGMLPDRTLPEVDFALAEHFTTRRDLEGSANLASLIARYATEAILPQVTEKLDSRIGKWACDIQNPILAYLLRVNPAQAQPRIEQAVDARGKTFSGCNHGLFQSISEIHYDPVLEETAIRALDDPDPEVAMTAATMLGKFGSAAAESALWQRYASWNARWAGHESEFDRMSAEGLDDQTYQLGLGDNLTQALATGKSWLTDKGKLQRLADLTKVRRLHQQHLDRYLKLWEEEPFTIEVSRDSSPYPFHATVAQYEFQSLAALKEKLIQFPAGTKFLLFAPFGDSPATDESFADLREFLSSQGMVVVEPKRAN
jgi:hypothetical protein